MAKQLFIAITALVFITSGALADDHAITPDELLPYATAMVGTREVCTTRKLVAGFRTDCRTEALPVERPLKASASRLMAIALAIDLPVTWMAVMVWRQAEVV
jgi:hypothetical protein